MVRCVGDMIPNSTRSLLSCGSESQNTVRDISEFTSVFAVFLSASITLLGWLPELADTCKTDVLFRVSRHNLINLFVYSYVRFLVLPSFSSLRR
jgi:hypothetical protein